jgi:NADPH2:quinone reductase
MTEYGPPAVLEWVETEPQPLEADEVRLDVIAAPVNRADVEIRSGTWPIRADDPWPYTPGLEFVGEVTETGAHVDAFAPGDRAITMMQKMAGIHGIRPGGYQESVVVPGDTLAALDADVDPVEMAALGLAAVTALEGVRRLRVEAGDRVVVHGATGGVGANAVQLVRAFGGTVIATTRRAEVASGLRELGAERVVDLSDSGLVEALGRDSVDAVFETVGQATFVDSAAVLARHGRLCCVGAASGAELTLSAWDLLQDLHLTGYSTENLTADQLRTDVTVLTDALRSGDIEPPPFERLPLSQAAEAHRRMEAGDRRGRLILIPEEVD